VLAGYLYRRAGCKNRLNQVGKKMAQIISYHLSEYTDVMSYAKKHFHGDFLMTLNFLYCMHNPVKDCWSKHLKRFLQEKRNKS